jgi:GT2 family glycosyltransferase
MNQIYYSIPYDVNKNMGKYYNDFMKLLPDDDDYACFVDGDTIFTTSNYGHIINDVINKYPYVGCFTSVTNRVNCKWQIAEHIDVDDNDMQYHREFGKYMQDTYGSDCDDVTNNSLMSGFLILLKKDTWKKIGGFLENGMLGVDNDMHNKIQKCGEKMYIMKGIYLYHWYRYPNYGNISHLK